MNLPFIELPSETYAAEERLRAFVKYCRYELTVFGPIVWEDSLWNLTETFKYRGRETKASIRFYSLPKIGTPWSGAPPMEGEFAEFAKAFSRYRYGIKPTKNINNYCIAALRVLERAMQQQGKSDITKLNAADFDIAAQFAEEKWEVTAGSTGNWLEEIARFISTNGLVETPFMWSSWLKSKTRSLDRTGKSAEERRQKVMPTERALDALAIAFQIAEEDHDVLVASAGAMLVAAPNRINEVVRLHVNAEVRSQDESQPAYGWRWPNSKKGCPDIKWITSTFSSTAEEAFRKIKFITEQARQIALWYEKNPKAMYLPPEYEYLRESEYLKAGEVEALVGSAPGLATTLLKTRGIEYEIRKINGRKGYSRESYVKFVDLEASVLKELPHGFPIRDKETGLRFSESLFVVPKKFFRFTSCSLVMFEPVTSDNIAVNIGRNKIKQTTIFDRLGLFENDGSPIRIRTHQFRHWQNHLLRIGGASEAEIARYSGRRDIRENRAYDHMTAAEMLALVDEIGAGPSGADRTLISVNPPVTRTDIHTSSYPTAHQTEFGICIHDWVMAPCPRHRDCINCRDQVCKKGDVEKEARIRASLSAATFELNKARQTFANGSKPAGRWIKHHELTVRRLTSLVSVLDDPTVPIGSLIRLNIDDEYSAIEFALQDYIGLNPDERQRALHELRAGYITASPKDAPASAEMDDDF